MRYYLITYARMRPENDPIEITRDESDRLTVMISYLNLLLDNEDDLYRALQHSFNEQIFWPEGSIHGYAIATEFQVDPIDG